MNVGLYVCVVVRSINAPTLPRAVPCAVIVTLRHSSVRLRSVADTSARERATSKLSTVLRLYFAPDRTISRNSSAFFGAPAQAWRQSVTVINDNVLCIRGTWFFIGVLSTV